MNPCKENQVSGDALGPFHWAVTHGIRLFDTVSARLTIVNATNFSLA